MMTDDASDSSQEGAQQTDEKLAEIGLTNLKNNGTDAYGRTIVRNIETKDAETQCSIEVFNQPKVDAETQYSDIPTINSMNMFSYIQLIFSTFGNPSQGTFN